METCEVIITARKISGGKVMFLHVCFILSTEGGYDVISCLVACYFWGGYGPCGYGQKRGMVSGVEVPYPPVITFVAATEFWGTHHTGMHSYSSICNRSQKKGFFTHMKLDSGSR